MSGSKPRYVSYLLDWFVEMVVEGVGPDFQPIHVWEREINEGEWRDKANCADLGTDLFFPTRENGLPAQPGKDICSDCSVSIHCLAFAIFTNQRQGTWGGESPEARKAAVRRIQYHIRANS